MPFYYRLRREDPEVQQRTSKGLLALKKGLDKDVPRRTVSDTLLLATWNIREFDSNKYGERSTESFYYIAEIIDHFDLVAVQEVREDLDALERLMDILGRWWKYIVTDVTMGSGGNGERMAFLYDSRKVEFGGLAGELVLPPTKTDRILQFARTPFICGFKAGWSKFNLCTVHIYYGTSKADDPRRVEEIDELASVLAERAEKPVKQPAGPGASPDDVTENLILLGDFNIFSPEDATMKALTSNGFKVPESLADLKGSNLDQEKHYDQIAYRGIPHRFEATNTGGIFNFYDYVFKPDEAEVYADLIAAWRKDTGKTKGDKKTLQRDYKRWRTHQMSDHLVLWAEFRVDFSTEYLEERAAQAEDA